MNLRSAKWVLIVAGLLFTGGPFESAVSAQQPAADASPSNSGVSVDVTVRADSQMTGQQMMDWVAEQTSIARQTKIVVQNMLDQSRREKDVINTSCLDDLLTQINVNIRGIEERTEALKTTITAGDQDAANQQFTILKVYFTRIQGLMAEAQNCVGDSDVVLGESETTLTIDEDITGADPSEDLGESPPEIDLTEQTPHRSSYY